MTVALVFGNLESEFDGRLTPFFRRSNQTRRDLAGHFPHGVPYDAVCTITANGDVTFFKASVFEVHSYSVLGLDDANDSFACHDL